MAIKNYILFLAVLLAGCGSQSQPTTLVVHKSELMIVWHNGMTTHHSLSSSGEKHINPTEEWEPPLTGFATNAKLFVLETPPKQVIWDVAWSGHYWYQARLVASDPGGPGNGYPAAVELGRLYGSQNLNEVAHQTIDVTDQFNAIAICGCKKNIHWEVRKVTN